MSQQPQVPPDWEPDDDRAGSKFSEIAREREDSEGDD